MKKVITFEEKIKMIGLRDMGLNNAEIGRMYGVSRQRVYQIFQELKAVDKNVLDIFLHNGSIKERYKSRGYN